MIKVKNRGLYAPSSSYERLGFIGDNKVEIRRFEITQEWLFGFDFKLDLKADNDFIDIVDLEKRIEDNRVLLTWIIEERHISNVAKNGVLYAQLRAFNDTELKWHSDIIKFRVGSSISATESYPSSLPSEFEIMEQRITVAKSEVIDARNEVVGLAEDVSNNTQTVSDNTEIVTQLAEQAVDNVNQVNVDKDIIGDWKIEVEANKNTVNEKTAIVVAKEENVSTKHNEVVSLVSQVDGDAQQVSLDKMEVTTDKQTVFEKTAEALQSALNALESESKAKVSETNAKGSEASALESMQIAVQAMTDLLNMMGEDIATLTDGKLTPSQIPPLSINDVFEVDSINEILTLVAQRGDVALVMLDDNIHDSYMLAVDDPTQLENWKKLGVSYVANAGHAVTADTAENANKINNKRLVAMTESQYDVAVKNEDTFYAVVPD